MVFWGEVEKITQSRSKTFFMFCFCFILGVGLFSFANANKLIFILYLLLFIFLFLLILLWSRSAQRFLLLCCLIFILGGLRFLSAAPAAGSKHISNYNGGYRAVMRADGGLR